MKSYRLPAILVINKVDIAKKDKLLVTIDKYSKMFDFKSIIPISALTGEGVDIVMNELKPFLRNERWYFPEDMVTDPDSPSDCRRNHSRKIASLT